MAQNDVPPELAGLPYHGRVRRAVEVGRRSRTDPAAAAELRRWEAGGFSARLLAAFAGYGSRDADALARLAADPSRVVAGVAFGTLLVVGDDAAVLAALDARPTTRAAAPLARLRRRKRLGLIDRYLDARVAAGDAAAWPLVPLGSAGLVERHLRAAAERGGAVFWSRLAARHPTLAAAAMADRLAAAAAPDGVLFVHAQTVLAGLAGRHPDLALAVAAALRRHRPLAPGALAPVAARRPAAAADFVLADDSPPYLSFDRGAGDLGAARLVALARRHPSALGPPAGWLPRLAPADRAAVYRDLSPAWTGADGVVPAAVLAALPAGVRVPEARRVAALPALAARPLDRLPFAALLPWDEAVAACDPWLNHPEAEYRAAALAALCGATRFDRAKLPDLLERLAGRAHEQDPVRVVFLAAVAGLPPGLWAADHLPGLGQLVRDALDAADLSGTSVAALGRLVFRLLPVHPGWAVEQIGVLTRERGFPAGGPGRPFTPDEVRRMAPALTPVLEAWSAREQEAALVGIAAAVGRHLPLWPDLGRLLERLTEKSIWPHTASTAMAMLMEHRPADRERLATAALARDPSWVLQPAVLNYLHARRQDLLTPFLGRRAYAGRFSTGKVRYVLPLDRGFHRWTDAQQEEYADALAAVAAPPRGKTAPQVARDVLTVVRRLPALPAVGPDRLVALARDRRKAVREAAVRALGRFDAGQGVPELLECLADDRARFAVYALRATLRDLPPDRVLDVLRAAPRRKVTVAKEAVRLAGEFGGPAAVGWFAELDGGKLHRDVRGALLRALWDHLERPEAWAVLDRAAAAPDAGVVVGLARVPVDRLSAPARARVAGLMVRLLGHPEPTVRAAVLARLAAEPVPDPDRAVLAAVLAKAGSAVPDERAAGLEAALAGATDADAPRFAAAYAALVPRRRELAAAVEVFAARTARLGRRLAVVHAAVLAAVSADPGCAAPAARLAAATLPADELAGWVEALAGGGRWHVGVQAVVLAAVTGAGLPAADLDHLSRTWARSPDPAVRWLGVRALAAAGTAYGWTADRRGRLLAARSDPAPAAADEAAFVFPPDDPPGG